MCAADFDLDDVYPAMSQPDDIESKFAWDSTALDWSTVATRKLHLSLPDNNAATGAPAITGDAEVGETLTAVAGTLADADGLPTTTFPAGYSFQWVRVDGVNMTDISGATSQTYTLADDDLGKTVKVKVSFKDQRYVASYTRNNVMVTDAPPETRESAATDTVTDKPGAPRTFTATAGDTQVTLAWTAPASDGSSAITKYQYRYAAGNTVADNVTWNDVPDGSDAGNDAGNETGFVVTSLTNGTEYAFEVRAVNSVGEGVKAGPETATPVDAATGQTLVSNVGQTQRNTITLGTSLDVAQPFTTGSNNAGYRLTSIELRLRTTSGTDVPTVKVFSGSATGTELASLDGPASLDANSNKLYTFTVTTGETVKLNASTNYWVVAEGGSSGLAWSYTNSTNEDAAAPGWSIDNRAQSRSASATGAFTDFATASYMKLRVKGSVLPNTPPTVVNAIPNQAATVGTPFSYAFLPNTFGDVDGDTLTYAATQGDDTMLPTWLTLTPATRTFSGTPMAADVETLEVKVTASDGHGGAVSDTFDIVVSAASSLVSNIGQSEGSGNLSSSPVAQRFTTGSHGGGYYLTSADIKFTTLVGTVQSISVCETDASGFPTAVCTTLNVPTGVASGDNTFPRPDGMPMELTKDTTYALLITPSGSVAVTTTDSDNEDMGGAAGWSIADLHSERSGGSWTDVASPGPSLMIRINGGERTVANNAATGAPEITGTAQEGQTLTAGAGDIADADGLPAGPFPTGYTFQWVRVVSGADTDISGATSRTYTLAADDVDHTVKVKVSFTDGANNPETLTSAAHPTTGTVLSSCPAPDFGTRRNFWTGEVTVGSRGLGAFFPGVFDYGYRSGSIITRFGALNPTDFSIGAQSISIEEVTVRKGGASDGNLSFDLDENLSYTQAVALELHVCHVTFDLVAETNSPGSAYRDFTKSTALDWSGVTSRTLYLSLPANTDATGTPEITGTVQVGKTLTAGTGTIADADGLPTTTFPASYSLQWVRVDSGNETDIPGATSQTYELTDDDLGKTVKVKVSFRDQRYVESYTQGDTMVTSAPLETRESAASNTVVTDTTAPALATTGPATVDGTSLVLTYNEVLDGDSTPAASQYTVTVDGAPVTVSSVNVDGMKVTLTLATAVTSGQTVTVSYTVPGSNPVQDTAGNDAPALSSQTVTNNTNSAPTGAPTISGVAQEGQTLTANAGNIADTNGLPAGTFPTGYTFQWVRVNSGGMESDITGQTSRNYTLTTADVGNTVKVKVSFTDGANNPETLTSAATATVSAKPSPQTLVSNVGESQTHTYTFGTQSRAQQFRAGSNTDGYTLTSIELRLLTTSGTDVPTVKVFSGSANGAEVATLNGPTSLDANTTKIYTFTVTAGETVTLNGSTDYWVVAEGGSSGLEWTYTTSPDEDAAAPGWSIHNKAQWRNAGDTGGFTDFAADGSMMLRVKGYANTDTTAPALATTGPATVDGTSLVLTYDEALDGDSTPTASQYTVTVDGNTVTVSSVSVDGMKVTLTLAEAVTSGQTVTVSYTVPGSNPVQDTAGNDAPALSSQTVTNNVAPTFSSASVDGDTLVITFNETLAAAANLANSAFTVKKTPSGLSETTVNLSGTPSISGATVTLTLAAAVASTDGSVKVSYTKPGTDNNNRLEDAAGNEVASFTDEAVTNATTATNATGAPTISGVAQAGQTLTANAGNIDDTDGLPAGTFPTGYTFQWVRVVSGVDSDITGQTSRTYTLATADVGNTVKVKVSFTDGANNAETLTSAAHPATGSVLSASACAAPDFGTRRHFWTGNLTVGSIDNVDSQNYGFDTADSIGALPENTFTVGSTQHEIVQTTVTTGGTYDGELGFGLEDDLEYRIGGSLRLHVCAVDFDLGDYYDTTQMPVFAEAKFTWEDSGLNWSSATSRTLYLSLPANNAATGAPEITGTAQVDETLTAGVGTIADADGLPTTTFPMGYSFQWVRVETDGTTETDISGATSQSYVLTNDDLGKTVKVKVSFKDQRYVASYTQSGTMVTDAPPETRESAASNTVTADTTAPALATTGPATVDGTSLVLTYSEALDEDSTPTASQYTVTVDGTSVTVNSVSVDGMKVTLTLATAVTSSQTVTVSYTVPGSNPVQDTAGNDAPALSSQTVTNNVAPVFSSASVDGDTLVITFNAPLAAAANLESRSFTVKKTPSGGNEATVSLTGSPSISGATVTLTLAAAVVSTDSSVKVSYTKPGTDDNNRLEDAGGNEVASFTDQAVTNATAPTFSSATVDGDTLVITFNEALAAASNLANSAFTVKKTPSGGNEATVSLTGSPSISGAKVTLTLAAAVAPTDGSVKVSYTKPGTDNNNRLEDAAGNEVANFTDQPVTNNTNNAPTVDNAISDQSATAGTMFSLQFPENTFADVDTGDTLSYTAAQGDDSLLPTWLSFNANTRTFSGTPAVADGGVLTVKVTANDGSGGTVSDTFHIAVATAQALVKNTAQTPDLFGNAVGVDASTAQQFTTGATPGGYKLTEVEIYLIDTFDAAQILRVSIYSDDGSDEPDASLHELTNPTSFVAGSFNFFTAPSNTILSPNTKYFAVVESLDSGSFTIGTTASDSEDSGAASNWSIADALLDEIGDVWLSTGPAVRIAVRGVANNPATGKPSISGTVQVGETLTANAGTGGNVFADDDNLPSGTFPDNYTFKWFRFDADGTSNRTEISGETSRTYTLAAADAGKTVKVEVSFTDGAGFTENLISDATGVVQFAPPTGEVEVPADWPLIPTGLSSGDTFRLLLVTSTQQNAVAANLANYDAVVRNDVATTGHASIQSHSARFQMLGCSQTVSAITHTRTGSSDTAAPIYWLNGAKVADDYADFYDGSWDSNEVKYPSGESPTPSTYLAQSHVGCQSSGQSQTIGFLGSDRPINGRPRTAGSELSFAGTLATNLHHYLGLSGIFTVADSDNTAPTASNAEVTTNEDVDYTFKAGDFNFTDTDTGDALDSVKIESLPTGATGTLELDGTAIAAANLPQTVTKTQLDENKLVYDPPDDANGNDYTSFMFKVNDGDDDSASSYTMTIDVDPVPDVTDVEVTSTPTSGTADPKDTYGVGEKIQVTVTFDETVDVDGDPTLNVMVGTNPRAAAYTSGTGTTELIFEYTVVAADMDSNGVSIAADALELDADDKIEDSDDQAADVTFLAVAADTDHKVNGSLTPPASIAPTFSSASVDGATLVITMSESLVAATNLANSAFSVKKTPNGGSEATVALSSSTPPSISGTKVTLTLAAAVVSTDTGVKVSYTKPSSGSDNRLKDADDNEAASFTDQAVTNATAPTVSSAAVDGATLVVTFNEALAAAANLANSAFAVKKTPNNGSETAVSLSGTPSINGAKVTLTLAAAVVATDGSVKVSYTKPGTDNNNRLEDAAGNEVASFTDQAVTNNTNTAPTAANGEETTDEDVEYEFDSADFNFSDTDSGDALASVKIVTLPSNGTLKLDGTAIPSTDLPKTVTKAELDDDKLVYDPPDDANGDDYTSFTFKVNDGDDDSALSYTMTIDVDPVPDVTDVEVTSTPTSGTADPKDTYGVGEKIQVTVTFDEAVTVTAAPTLGVMVGTNTRTATYESGSGSTKLVFEYTVVAEDMDNNGVSIAANAITVDSSNKIEDSDDQAADVTFTAVAADTDHKVNGSLTPPSSNTAPTVDNEIPDQFATVGTALSYAFPEDTFADVDSDTLTYTATKGDDTMLPSWLTFTAGTRTFSGTPQTADLGRVTVKVTANDNNGGTVSDEFDIVVAKVLISNMGRTADNSHNSSRTRAQRFTTGSHTGGYSLTGAEIFLGSGESGINIESIAVCETDASGFPTSTCTALNAPSDLRRGTRMFNRPAGMPMALNANTEYTLVITPKPTESVVLGTTSSTSEDPGGATGWSIADTYEQVETDVGWLADTSRLMMRIRINGEETTTNTNNDATGAPNITGTAQVGQTLTADKGTINDADGEPSGAFPAGYTLQWVRVDGTTETDIIGATSETYTLTDDDPGKTIKVRVAFDDGAGNPEKLISAATAAVSPLPSLVSNIGQRATPQYYDLGPANGNNVYAASFATGTTGATLTGIDVRLRNPTLNVVNTIPTVKVYEGTVSGGELTLGDELATLAGPTSLGTFTANYTFNAPENTTLSASTTYYVLFELTGGNVDMVYTASSALDSGGQTGWGIPNTSYSRASANTGPLTAAASSSILIRVRGTLTRTNNAPTVANRIPDQAASVGTALSYAFPDDTFSDEDSDTLTYTATKGDGTDLPSWLIFTAATRTFSGTPLAADVGKLTVKVTADDSNGGTVSDEFDIFVSTSLITNVGQRPFTHYLSNNPRAQRFTTGSNTGGYFLTSVEVILPTPGSGANIQSFSVCETDASGYPTSTCTALNPPANVGQGTRAFSRPVGMPMALIPNTEYTVLITPIPGAHLVGLGITDLGNEDAGGAAGWSIADKGTVQRDRTTWQVESNDVVLKIRVNGQEAQTNTNSAATGAPTISGTVHVGQTLTANRGSIGDTDGLPTGTFPAGYTLQWLRVNGTTETNIAGQTSETYTLTDADKGKTIKVRVAFDDGAGNPEKATSAATGTILGAPDAPQTFTATAGDAQVTLAWTAPADNGGSAVTKYQYRHEEGTEVTDTVEWNDVPDGSDAGNNAADETGFVVTSLTNDTEYAFEVRAVNAIGEGAKAGPETATPSSTDTTAPTVVSIERQTPSSSPTNVDTLIWRVTFSEAVKNVDATDFERTGTTATLSVAAVSGSETAYDVTLMDGNLAGLNDTVTLSFATGQNIQDAASNALTATTPTGTNDDTYVVDNTSPTVTIAGVPSTSLAPFTVQFTFSESVSGFAVGDITVGNGTASNLVENTALTTAVEDTVFTALITPTANGAVTVDVNAGVATDAADNGNAAATRATSTYTAAPVLVSNIGQTSTDEIQPALPILDVFQGFRTSGAANLAGVEVSMRLVSTSQHDHGLPTMTLHTSRTTAAVATLTAASTTILSDTAANVTYAAPTGTNLTANSTYYVNLNGGSVHIQVLVTNLDAEDSGGQSGWSIDDGYFQAPSSFDEHANSLLMRVRGTVIPNRAATGTPTIAGTTTVGETLTANQGTGANAFADADGLPDGTFPAGYRFQWVRFNPDGTSGRTVISGATNRNYQLTGTDFNMTVKVEVSFTDDLGYVETRSSAASSVILAAPSPPQTFTATPGDTRVTLAWTAPVHIGGSAITKYQYRYSTGSTVDTTQTSTATWTDIPDSTDDTDTNAGNETSFVVTSLVNGTEYAFELRAVNAVGESEKAGPRTATPASSDTVAPTVVSITRQTPSSSPTNANTLVWRVAFSEAVTNVNAADFSVSNTTASLSVVPVSGSETAFDVTLTSGNLAGLNATVTLSFVSGQDIEDANGNDLTNTTPTGTNDDTWVVDNTAPTVTIGDVPSTSTAAFTAKFTFTESVSGFVLGDITVGNGAASNFTVDDTTTAVNTVFTALITPTANGAVTVDVNANVATDAAGNGNDAATRVTSTYTAPNNPPVFADTTLARSVAENTAADSNVGAAIPVATDADNDSLTYTMEGTNAASFAFDGATRQIKTRTNVAYDFEARSTYLVTIKADDGKGGTDTVAVIITLTDVDEPPNAPAAPTVTATSNTTTSLDVSWSAPTHTDRPTISSYDLRYCAGSAADCDTDADFTNGPQNVTGTSATITGLPESTIHQVQVRATNDEGDSDWSSSGSGSTGTPANNPPVFADTTLARSVAENTTADSNVGAVIPVATDVDGDTLTYTMEGADASSFTFDATARQIKTRTGETYDFEDKPAYSVTIKVDDGKGGADTVAVIITLTDVNEPPNAPAAPTVTATTDTTTSLDVSWTEAENTGRPPIASYDLRYCAGSAADCDTDSDFTNGPQDVTGASATITGLPEGTVYQVQVRATNDESDSDWSSAGSGSTGTPANNPPTVDNPIPGQAETAGMAFSYTIPEDTFSDDDGDPLTYTATRADDTRLPAWLRFNPATRTFSGTPRAGDAGTLPVKVTADDGKGESVSHTFNIVISAGVPSALPFESLIVEDGTLTVTFTKPLDPASNPSDDHFWITGTATRYGTGISNATLDTARSTLVLTVGHGMDAGWDVRLNYDPTTTKRGSHRYDPDATPIRFTDGTELRAFTNVEVTNITPDRIAPRPVKEQMWVDGTTLTLPYDEALDSSSVPAAGQFDVRLHRDHRRVGRIHVERVRISGSVVTLTLEAPAPADVGVSVNYWIGADEDSVPFKDLAGNIHRGGTRYFVDNRTKTARPPGMDLVVDGSTLTITFDRRLDPASNPSDDHFWFTGTAARYGTGIGAVTLDAARSTLVLTFGHGMDAGWDVRLNYDPTTTKRGSHRYDPDATPVRFTDGTELAAFANVEVTNITPDTTAPRPVEERMWVDGATLTLPFDEALDSSSVPAAWEFDVRLHRDYRRVGRIHVERVRIRGSEVTLTLEEPVPGDAGVSVNYWFEPDEDAVPFRDLAGNVHLGGTRYFVDNRTRSVGTAGALESAEARENDASARGDDEGGGEAEDDNDDNGNDDDGNDDDGDVDTAPDPGPAEVSVADARVREGPGATLDFVVTLSHGAKSHLVWYETANGTATAGEDYTAKSGSVFFAPGVTSKTVSVTVLDDSHDEGMETITLRLTDVTDEGRIVDGEATGTIENSDPLPAAWIGRLGRAAADNFIEAVGRRWERLGQGPPETHFTLGGRRLDTLIGGFGREADSPPLVGAPPHAGNGPSLHDTGVFSAGQTGTAQTVAGPRGAGIGGGGAATWSRGLASGAAGGPGAIAGPIVAGHPGGHFAGGAVAGGSHGGSDIARFLGTLADAGGAVADGSHGGSGIAGFLGTLADAGGAVAGGSHGGSGVAGFLGTLAHAGGDAQWAQWLRQANGLAYGPRIRLRDALMNSSFQYSPRPAAGSGEGGPRSDSSWLGNWAAWGESSSTRFSGAEGTLSLRGDIGNASVGFDSRRGPWLTGVALSYTDAHGSFSHPSRSGGTLAGTLTTLSPYAHLELSDRSQLWGVAGYGAGQLALTPANAETAIETGLANTFVAVGGRTALSAAVREAGRFELAVRSDARFTKTRSDAATTLMGAAGATSRVRALVEGRGLFSLPGYGTLTPTLEAGLRYDGGDAETGAGLEMAVGLGYAVSRLTVQIDARGLLAHQDAAYEEWGYSATVGFTPRQDGLGLSMNIGSLRGAAHSSVQSLWSAPDAAGLARGGSAMHAAERLRTELGYGFGSATGRMLFTPYLNSEIEARGGRTLGLGLRLASGTHLNAGLEFGRRESFGHAAGSATENTMQFQLAMQW